MSKNDDLVQDYARGLSLRAVAKKHNVTQWEVQAALKEAGVELRSRSASHTRPDGRLDATTEVAVIATYQAGASLTETANRHNLRRGVAQRVLARAGAMRSRSEAVVVHHPESVVSDPSAVVDDYVLRHLSVQQIADARGHTHWAVQQTLKAAGVERRDIQTAAQLKRPKNIALAEHRAAIIELCDGLMLGDGNISPSGELAMSQSVSRYEWSESIQLRLAVLGIAARLTRRSGASVKPRLIDGREIVSGERSDLRTLVYDVFFEQRQRWYPNGTKIVPRDLVLTPYSTAQWFAGDGAAWSNGGLCFCTDCFTVEDVDLLRRRLFVDLGVTANRINRSPRKDQWTVHIGQRLEAVRLRDAIIEHVHPCCHYKLAQVALSSTRRIDWSSVPFETMTNREIADKYHAPLPTVISARARMAAKRVADAPDPNDDPPDPPDPDGGSPATPDDGGPPCDV